MAYQNSAGAWLRESVQGPQITGSTPYKTYYGPNQNNTWGVNGAGSTLVGGAQDDYFWLPDPGYKPVEGSGGGVDTVHIWHKYVLPSNIENLTVFGDGQYASGNDSDNIIKATGRGDFIYGARGNDVFIGSGGSGTTFVVAQGEGDKVIQNFAFGADTLRMIGGGLTSFSAVKSAMTQQGSDVVLNAAGTRVIFRNAQTDWFQDKNFQLPLNYSSLGSQTFSEEFDSASIIGSKWQPQFREANVTDSYTLPRNGEQQIYTNANFTGTGSSSLGLNPFSFNNGVMTITAKPVSDAQSAQMWGYKYSSGMLQTTSFAQTYGYFEMRADLPDGQGLWPAFWLLGEQNREIDVLEALGSDPRSPFQALHSPAIGDGYSLANFNPYADGFHTYGVMWDAKNITFYVDGTEVWETPTPSDMHSPLRMIVNLAVGGHWPGSPDGSTPWPAEMKVDYIKAYNLPGVGTNTGATPPPPTTTAPAPAPAPAPTDGSNKVLTATTTGAVLTGGTGADTLNASQGYDTLTGGAGADRFVFGKEPWAPIQINDFVVGQDKLDLSALFKASGYTGSNPIADRYVYLQSDGAGGSIVRYDRDGAGGNPQWPNTIINLKGVAPAGLTWSQLSDATGVTAPAPSPTPTPTPTSPTSGAGQVLTATTTGAVLTGGSGADTISASQGFDTLTGGGGADRFVFAKEPWAPIKITDFQLGADTIDLSALFRASGYTGSNPVADRYVVFESNGAGGALVRFDRDGAGTGQVWPNTIIDLQNVSPTGLTWGQLQGGGATAPAPTPTAPTAPSTSAGQTLTANSTSAVLQGGSGADTITASMGYDTLSGGAGADRFVIAKEPWAPIRITDFATGEDKLDLRGLFDAAGYTGSNPIGDRYVYIESDKADGSLIRFDRDAAGQNPVWPNTIVHLEHVAPSKVTSSDWIVQ